MSAEAIQLTDITATREQATAEHLINARTALCRFCDRPGATGHHRAPGPLGPICPGCLADGRKLCQDGKERFLGGLNLARLVTAAGIPCEFCDRDARRGFFHHPRPLPRMRRIPGDAVICVDCLVRGTQLLARVSGVCHG